MERTKKIAIVASLLDALEDEGSWCGETHLQKAMYFLQRFSDASPKFDFILYKHGPFSFELRDELANMRAAGLVRRVPSNPYGPRLQLTPSARGLMERYPKTLARFEPLIRFISERLGPLGVGELERLSTALLLRDERGHRDPDHLIAMLRRIKPHISELGAKEAVREIEDMEGELRKVVRSGSLH